MSLPWYLDFFTYYLRCRVLNKKSPILAGFKITGRCNLTCIHCPFWERPAPLPLTFSQVRALLLEVYRQGVRILILEGGEPFLWKDGDHTKELGNDSALADRIFEVATTNGFFEVMKQREYANIICFIDYYSPRKKHRVSWIIDDNKLPKVIITLLEEFGKLRK